MFEVIKMNL